jgi:hypothetical protein
MDPNFLFFELDLRFRRAKRDPQKARKDRDDVKHQIGHLYAGKLNG